MEREAILSKIIEELKSKEHIHLILEGGSKAFKRFDEFSDIDIMIGVEDDKVDETFQQFENFLEDLAGIETTLPWAANKGFHHKFYKLKNTHPYHVVDFYLIEQSVENKELETQIHGDLIVYFDRFDYMKKQGFNQNAFDEKVDVYGDKMKRTFEFFFFMVEKEIARGHYIDALTFYFELTIKPLTRLLRIKYNPVHYNFELRYLYDELPKNITDELEQLLSISNMNDLSLKHKQAFRLYERDILLK
ncbi:MAG: polymerase beta domain protein region [Bacteroidota bacterium]|nr:polymerase beta domain protein region [Bacteroidota bacterium]